MASSPSEDPTARRWRSGVVLPGRKASGPSPVSRGTPWARPVTTLREEAHKIPRESIQNAWRNGSPGVQVRAETIEGVKWNVLTEVADAADLLVVGSRGRTGSSSLLLGSVSLSCTKTPSANRSADRTYDPAAADRMQLNPRLAATCPGRGWSISPQTHQGLPAPLAATAEAGSKLGVSLRPKRVFASLSLDRPPRRPRHPTATSRHRPRMFQDPILGTVGKW